MALTLILLDTRNLKKTGKYPVKLRVTHNRVQKYYPIKIDLTEDEYKKCQQKNPKGDYKKWKQTFEANELKASNIIANLPVFSFDAFKKKFEQNQQSAENVYTFYENIIADLKRSEQLGTASNYQCSLNSLKAFKPALSFYEVTKDFLVRYEQRLLQEDKSITTVGIYLRPLRSILNIAIAEGIISKENNYPFGKGKYQIPTSKNIKKALTLPEIALIYKYDAPPGSWEDKARDFWIFSYLANGMNMKDIALLRFKNIQREFIQFNRAKTIRTNSTHTPISLYITPELQLLIDKWKNTDQSPQNYLFPILTTDTSVEKQRSEIKQFTKMVNKYMAVVAEALGIDKPITTYYARHSFATILKRSGANISNISEALGHSSEATTKAYLGSFDDDAKKEMAKALTAF